MASYWWSLDRCRVCVIVQTQLRRNYMFFFVRLVFSFYFPDKYANTLLKAFKFINFPRNTQRQRTTMFNKKYHHGFHLPCDAWNPSPTGVFTA